MAHEPDGGDDDDDDLLDGGLSHVVVPPSIHSAVEAVWPTGIVTRGDVHVHLELQIDAQGRVSDVRVLESGGERFDDAAVAAVKQYEFNPATEDGVPVRSFVTYTYVFRAPPEMLDAGLPPTRLSTTVTAQRPISASSSFSVRDRDFALRPIGSVQDILRVTPGLVVVQHSGGGKANQYFLRGFDADHGTDVALSIDGVPINMVSHGHGQGYADTNFIIPEVVERVELTKGTSFANQGDFATAGSINLLSREGFEQSSVGISFGGSPGNGVPMVRALAIASPKFSSAPGLKATFAAELGQENGPFVSPNAWNRYKLFNRVGYTFEGGSTVSLIHMGYGGDWKGSGQIAARAVEQGIIPRFGSLDPTEGGNSTRHQVALVARLRPTETSEFRALSYVGTYSFNMFSNFTGALVDPVNGDEIEQVDRRVFFGAKLSYRVTHKLGDMRFDTTVGVDARSDDIHNQLWHTRERTQLERKRDNGTAVTTAGVYVNEEATFFPWLRLNVGGRVDGTTFSVEDQLGGTDPDAPRSGVGSAFLVSPKVNLIVSPLQTEDVQWDLFANYGHGFHSNDVRGVFSPQAVTPLTRARGGEVGTRARLFGKLDLAATGWMLGLDNETVWIGDEGTTEVSDPTLRYGGEFEARYEIFSWLAADLDVTFTRSQFAGDGGNGGGLALAPQQTWSGGLSARHQLGPGLARGGLRVYGIGDRPASADGVLKAPGWTQVDLHLGYRLKWFDVALDIENLLNGQYRGAQFATTSRLRNEPAVGAPVPAGFGCGSTGRLAPSSDGSFQGCEDVNFTPAYPFTMRVTATIYL
ncbi:MAG: TonB-dependent receptor [Archangium sp.]